MRGSKFVAFAVKASRLFWNLGFRACRLEYGHLWVLGCEAFG